MGAKIIFFSSFFVEHPVRDKMGGGESVRKLIGFGKLFQEIDVINNL